MEYCDFGKSEALKNRRISIITLQERGLKPREILKSLSTSMPDLIIRNIYDDLKWGAKHLTRDDREKLWDKHFMKEIERLLKDTKSESNKIGLLKLILQQRQDMRKRHGLYVDKVELSGEIGIREVLDDVAQFVNKYCTPSQRKELEEILRRKDQKEAVKT